MAAYTDTQLRNIFQSPFSSDEWQNLLQNFFGATELRRIPEELDTQDIGQGYYLGNIDTTDSFRIGLFRYDIANGSVANKRVGLRNLVRTYINQRYGNFDAALAVFDSGDHWRLSFICDIKDEATSPKRFTYVFGNRELLYKTAVERFRYMQKEGISFKNMKTAFSVEALSDEFFDRYREQYADFIQFITGKRFEKAGNKWVEKVKGEPDKAMMEAFGGDEKKIRDYVKKMMGRITFLHFLQRKGWMNGDLNYMQHLFERSAYQDDYLDSVLEPLFFGILNTKPEEREAVFEKFGWDKALLTEWKDIPYLNGGLFERDADDEPKSVFPAGYFRRLFQFFSEYNFTVDENDPNDAVIGVDPEMLGKIFENLLEDNKDKGAFYTPKEIVRYMCQESLIAYLDNATSIPEEKIRRFVLSPEDGATVIPDNKRAKLLAALVNVKICDPAIGSGAFPMGLLNELLRCREALAGEHYDRVAIKKSIIYNNIYGVDIEKGAVDIARLRFWLSIVVDEETPSPLPNLDYKIMQGNSLLESFHGVDLSKLTYEKDGKKDKGEISLFDSETNKLQKTVSQLLSAYYSCSDHNRKAALQQRISDTINKQLEVQAIDENILVQLRQINLAGNDQFFLWHTWFSDVFNREDGKSGFDIVIGNPPYGANIDRLILVYEKLYPNTSHGYKDIYKYFYDFSFSICNENGIICFITPNTFLRQPRYGDLRKVFLKSSIIKIVDLGENIFNEAVVPVAICFSKHITEINNTILFTDLTSCITALNTKDVLSQAKYDAIPQQYWNKTRNNVFINEYKQSSGNIVELDFILRFKDAGINYQRVKVGLSQKGKSDLSLRLLYEGEKESDIDIEYWKGVDINNFYVSSHTSRYCRPDISLREGERVILNKDYFSISPKLIWRQTAPYPICAIDYHGIWFGRSIQAGVIKPEFAGKISYEYLCGLLNSSYIRSVYEQQVKESGRAFPQVKLEKLKPLPIVIPTFDERKIVEDLVNQIIELKSRFLDASELEQRLNQVVNKLYNN